MKACKHLEDVTGNEICAGDKDGGRDACQGISNHVDMKYNRKSLSNYSEIKNVLKRFKVIPVDHYSVKVFRVPENIT